MRDNGQWLQEASCLHMDTKLFFPGINERAQTRVAISICETCPVIRECLIYNFEEETGIFGGKTASQRGVMRKKRSTNREVVNYVD